MLLLEEGEPGVGSLSSGLEGLEMGSGCRKQCGAQLEPVFVVCVCSIPTLPSVIVKQDLLLPQQWDGTRRLTLTEWFVAISRRSGNTCSVSGSLPGQDQDCPVSEFLPEAAGRSTEYRSYCAECEAVIEGGARLGSLGKSGDGGGASERGGDEQE